MNVMLFVFRHSENVKYQGNPCPNFFKGGLDDTFWKGISKGVQVIFCGWFKCSKWMKCFLFLAILKN